MIRAPASRPTGVAVEKTSLEPVDDTPLRVLTAGSQDVLVLSKPCYELGAYSQHYRARDAQGQPRSAKRTSVLPPHPDSDRAFVERRKNHGTTVSYAEALHEPRMIQRVNPVLAAQCDTYVSMRTVEGVRRISKVWLVSPLFSRDMLSWVHALQSEPADVRQQVATVSLRRLLKQLRDSHAVGVAHTDIKAENILCGRNAYGLLSCVLWDWDRAEITSDPHAHRADLQKLAKVALMLLVPGCRGKLANDAQVQAALEAGHLVAPLRALLAGMLFGPPKTAAETLADLQRAFPEPHAPLDRAFEERMAEFEPDAFPPLPPVSPWDRKVGDR